jgi:outer membrane protein
LGSAEAAVSVVDISAGPVKESLIEAGIFVGGGSFPDYPGANHNQGRVLPLPYLIYRGSVVRADERDGVRARMILAKRLHLEVSVAGSFPVNSKDNDTREGMPDLDWLGEIGPRLTFLITDPAASTRLKLLVPFRAVFSTNGGNFKHRGFSASPGFLLESFNFIRPRWRGIALLTAIFTDRQMNAYFYDVAPEFARSDRPVYDSRAGYLGTDLTLGLMVPFRRSRFRLFTGVQASYRDGAANIASPLFKSRTNYSLFAGAAYTFYRSRRVSKD